ncbi:MAG: sulfate ABC transporter substrate-binding protein [Synechococcus lacustris]
MSRRSLLGLLAVTGVVGSLGASWGLKAMAQPRPEPVQLTLVSYGVAKAAYSKLIPVFQKEWKAKTGQNVTFEESYGASGAQTRSILAGLEADVLAQNLSTFITPLVEKGLVSPDWDKRLPNRAVPVTTVMAVVVRPGNPNKIKSWSDLARPGVESVSLNPKTSGNARWGYLAGYGSVLKDKGDEAAKKYLFALVKNIKTQVNSGREATDAFIKNRVGEVLVTFENEIIATNDLIPNDSPYVVPTTNLKVEFPVTVIDKVVDKRGTRQVAEAFTRFLYTPKAQEIFAEAGYRPTDRQVLKRYSNQFRPVSQLHTVDDFGGWITVNKTLFNDDALFEQASKAAR